MREERQQVAVSLTTTVPGPHQIDLILDAATLNERLLEIGLWLIEWEIPHQAKVRMLPRFSRIRVCFPEERHSRAFHLHFAGKLVRDEMMTVMADADGEPAYERLRREFSSS